MVEHPSSPEPVRFGPARVAPPESVVQQAPPVKATAPVPTPKAVSAPAPAVRQTGAVDKVLFKNLYWKIDKKKDAHWRHFMAHIIRFKFK
ncbi:hypothetical protein, partial [Pseudoflavonifractor phocaeensis]|uniref:hypothetical protein n=1 Tax=Pseudoflavonifractor phocaeensis TaxID=1870988 RepID=UPI00195C493A